MRPLESLLGCVFFRLSRPRAGQLAAWGTALFACGSAACHPGPVPLDAQEVAASYTQPAASVDEVHFSGRVRLTGELAEREGGFLMVTIHSAGTRMPFAGLRYDLSLAGVASRSGDEVVVPFEIDAEHLLGPPPAGELVLLARYDQLGIVENTEGVYMKGGQVSMGEQGIDVVLGPEDEIPSDALKQPDAQRQAAGPDEG